MIHSSATQWEHLFELKITFQKGYISKDDLSLIAETMAKSEYGKYLIKILNEI